MVDAISQLGLGNSSNAAVSAKKFDEEYTNFLTLLTTQLQHQDPTSPMDSSEFTNQIVQFTSVEQQIQTNRNLENLTSLMMNSMNSDATSYLGKDAYISGGSGKLQNGQMEWTYSMPASVANAGLAIFDSSGKQVASMEAEKGYGNHTATWDGKDATGKPVEDGIYRMQVVAFDGEGTALDAPVYTRQRITEVSMSDMESIFSADGMLFTKADILKLSLAKD